MARWILDVRDSGDKVVLVIYDDERREISEMNIELKFYGYVLAREPDDLARRIVYEDLASEARVEEWLIPPFYREKTKLLVFITRDLVEYRRLRSLFRKRGFSIVNTEPHPLVEALYRSGIRPLTRLDEGSSSWDPRWLDPAVDHATISVENGFYVVETRRGIELVQNIRDLAYLLGSLNPLLVFSSKSVYVAVAREYGSMVKNPYLWVTTGPYSPHEVFEWCRLSYTPLSLMGNVTIGRLLSTMEALKAREWRYVTGREWGRPEAFRSIDELLLWDRGGPIHQPKPGLYWSVCQVDFRSLYPSIIAKLNISGETVDNPYCPTVLALSYAPHSICLDREGLVASTIRSLIDLKTLYEVLSDETGLSIYRERRSAVKWILVASFGYLGYRNSMFGSISAHEVVTSTARYLTAEASRIVSKLGYRVIHLLIDSLFIEGVESVEECKEIVESLEKELGYGLKIEAHYTWLYIPKSITTGFGASNKYYGALSTGGMKIKGVVVVRRDIPLFIKQVGLEALNQLSLAKNIGELREALSRAIEIIDNAKHWLMSRSVDTRLLVSSRVSEDRGFHKGDPFLFIATRRGFVPLGVLEDYADIDYTYYIKLLDRIREELPSLEEIVSRQLVSHR